jgi:hypothetical protein
MDSTTKLFFFDKRISSYIKMFTSPMVEQYLALRGVIPAEKMV